MRKLVRALSSQDANDITATICCMVQLDEWTRGRAESSLFVLINLSNSKEEIVGETYDPEEALKHLRSLEGCPT